MGNNIRLTFLQSAHGDYDYMEDVRYVLTTQYQLAKIIDMDVQIKKY